MFGCRKDFVALPTGNMSEHAGGLIDGAAFSGESHACIVGTLMGFGIAASVPHGFFRANGSTQSALRECARA